MPDLPDLPTGEMTFFLTVDSTPATTATMIDWLIRDLTATAYEALGEELDCPEFLEDGAALRGLPLITAEIVARPGKMRPYAAVCRAVAATIDTCELVDAVNAYLDRHGLALELSLTAGDSLIASYIKDAASQTRWAVPGSRAAWWAYYALSDAELYLRAVVAAERAEALSNRFTTSYNRLINAHLATISGICLSWRRACWTARAARRTRRAAARRSWAPPARCRRRRP